MAKTSIPGHGCCSPRARISYIETEEVAPIPLLRAGNHGGWNSAVSLHYINTCVSISSLRLKNHLPDCSEYFAILSRVPHSPSPKSPSPPELLAPLASLPCRSYRCFYRRDVGAGSWDRVESSRRPILRVISGGTLLLTLTRCYTKCCWCWSYCHCGPLSQYLLPHMRLPLGRPASAVRPKFRSPP